jgi:hypothetical protein
LPVPGGEEHHVLAGGDEVQGAQVGDQVAFEAAGVVEVEFLEALAAREPGGADAAFAAVGLAGGDLALQAGGEELLVCPALGPGSLGQPWDGHAQGRRHQCAGQERQLAGDVPPLGRALPCWCRTRAGGSGGHHATPPVAVPVSASRPSRVS